MAGKKTVQKRTPANIGARIAFIKDGYAKDPFAPSVGTNKEQDPDWKKWFTEIERRRHALHDRTKQKIIHAKVEKEGFTEKVARRRSEPAALSAFLKKQPTHTPKKQNTLLESYQEITRLWNSVVGEEIAAESELYSFKGGTVTITVTSGSLLQEMRQFHIDAIKEDLRNIWTLSTPLVTVKLRPGKKRGS